MPCNGDCNQGRECNCKCKMTDREKMKQFFDIYDNLEGYTDSDKAIALGAWQAKGELDAVRIKELEIENHALGLIIDNEDKELADKVAELTAKLDKAREILSMASWTNIGGYEGLQKWLELIKELDK